MRFSYLFKVSDDRRIGSEPGQSSKQAGLRPQRPDAAVAAAEDHAPFLEADHAPGDRQHGRADLPGGVATRSSGSSVVL